jgi:hypothetical protein
MRLSLTSNHDRSANCLEALRLYQSQSSSFVDTISDPEVCLSLEQSNEAINPKHSFQINPSELLPAHNHFLMVDSRNMLKHFHIFRITLPRLLRARSSSSHSLLHFQFLENLNELYELSFILSVRGGRVRRKRFQILMTIYYSVHVTHPLTH